MFPGDESSDSDDMIGGLGSKITKDMAQESSIFSHPSNSSKNVFDSFEDRTESVTKMDKEEEKVE